MERRRIVSTCLAVPESINEYQIKHENLHKVVCDYLTHMSDKGTIKSFQSQPEFTFSDTLLSNVCSALDVKEFAILLRDMPSYLAVITDGEIRVIIRDMDVIDNGLEVPVCKLRNWAEFKRCFVGSSLYVKFNGCVYEISVFDIINIYCLGFPSLAKYNGIVDNIHYNNQELLNVWSDYIDTFIDKYGDTIPEVKSVILQYIEENLSGGQIDVYNYIIMWLAYIVVNPNKKTAVCPIFVGEDANKSLFTFLGKYVFKHRYRKLTKLDQIIGRDNSKLLGTTLVVCNEFNTQHPFTNNLNDIKSTVTDSTITIEYDGNMNVGSVSNFVIFTDNKEIIGNSCFPVFDVKPSQTNVFENLTESDAQDFIIWLTHIDISEFNINDPPNNHKSTAIDHGVSFKEIISSLYIEGLPVDPRNPSYGVKFKEVHDRYLDLCKHHLRRPPISRDILYRDIKQYYNKSNNKEFIAEERGHKGWYLRKNKAYKE